MKSFDDVCLEKNIQQEDMIAILVLVGALESFNSCIINQGWINSGYIKPVPIQESMAAGVIHEYSPTDAGLEIMKKIAKGKIEKC